VRSELLGAGSYEIVFVATDGTKAGHRTTGKLVLRTSTPDDVSPRTGEKVAERLHHRLYGFIEFDFEEIGAPIFLKHTIVPAPNSTDPAYPGVLLQEDLKEIFGVPILTVATISNIRTGLMGFDGPGIGLFIHCLTPTEFTGTWGKWGIRGNGSGYFCARRMNVD